MIKITFEIEDGDHEKLKALTDAQKNYFLIESLYSEVFRNIIKHSDDETEVMYAQKFWELVSEHFKEG